MTTHLKRHRLALPQVTLCAATSVNLTATIHALEACLAQVSFADCQLMTDAVVQPDHPEIRVVPIERLRTGAAYSEFILTKLVDHIKTSHALVVQWDGHVVDADRWQSKFLDYDYVAASWPQFEDGNDVGNGGFSLRSRRLMENCRKPGFRAFHPEDIAVCRSNREWLEERGMRFAPREVANSFSAERIGDPRKAFGYHGVWNMPRVLGAKAFWKVYRGLDDADIRHRDFCGLVKSIAGERGGAARATRMIMDRLRHALRRNGKR